MATSVFGTAGRGLALATALVAGLAFTTAPQPAHALSTGAAVGLGFGALALGGVLGAAPYYGGYYDNPYGAYGYGGYGGYGYGYAPAAPAYGYGYPYGYRYSPW